MPTLEFDERKLLSELEQLTDRLRAAFAAACAERQFQCYVRYSEISKNGDHHKLARALDCTTVGAPLAVAAAGLIGTGVAAESAASGVQIFVNSAGEASVIIQGVELSIHAAEQATIRSISLDTISAAMKSGQSFPYVQKGQTLTGYYNALSNTFVGVGQRITTVINPTSNYVSNLLRRAP